MACLGFLLFFLLLFLLASTTAQGEYGVVHVVSDNWSKDYCILFRSDYVTLPRDLQHAPLLPLHDGTGASWCPGQDSSHQAHPAHPDGSASQRPLHRTTAMVMRGNCSFYDKGWLAQGRGAHGLLIVSRVSDQQCSDITPAAQNPHKPLPDLTIAVAVAPGTSHHRRGHSLTQATVTPCLAQSKRLTSDLLASTFTHLLGRKSGVPYCCSEKEERGMSFAFRNEIFFLFFPFIEDKENKENRPLHS